ncbi:hypothetical protein SAMN03159423_2416 [Bradyrhizobium sp. NFR13]|uniref:hypothetical protein n=1 Tax=Bradyrhizobium sp. NFR13 TaxID=1566285 RepID=UPI0008F418CC|nr:hypothetical protein [Bradyrhizobium sp. NFR13]SFL55067.1 hypothetical protein SAMN03159423_2416 [Bradyrhizobium sp. NFR13]
MAEKFDPAPHDKYAVGVKEAARADRKTSEELKTGLKDTFPASDPVSATQPDRSKHDSSDDRSSLWSKITGVFKS